MFIDVIGGTAKKREIAESIAEFSGAELMSTRLAKTLEINIELIPGLNDKEGVYGDCVWEDDYNRPKEFTIRVDSKMKPRYIAETVAHEMVHVKQWATGEMKELVRQNKTKFKGELFGDTEYWFRPWEIEAHGIEKGLFVKWAEATGVSNQKWTHDNDY